MRGLGRYAARVAVRRVVFALVLGVLGWAGIGRAEAQEPKSCSSLGSGCTIEEAFAYATWVASSGSNCGATSYTVSHANKTVKSHYMTGVGGGTCNHATESGLQRWVTGCPTGTEWSDYSKKCDTPCSQRPALTSGNRQQPGPFCSEGCQYAPAGQQNMFSVTGSDGVARLWYSTAGATPSGGTCAVEGGNQEAPPCQPLGDGQTACKRDDGQICHTTATTGRQICWTPGQTGEKTDGPDMQKASAGQNPQPPNNALLPSGDELIPQGPKTDVQHTSESGHSSTTNITNYTTAFGTNAGTGKDSGSKVGSGSGSGSGEGEGDGDGDGDGKGTATGGECGSGWTCSGDPIACAQLREAHLQRCALVDGPAEGELGNAEDGMGEGIGKLFGSGGDGMNVLNVLGGSINQTKQCPANPVIDLGSWGAIELPLDRICPHLQLLGTLMLGFAYLFAVKVMME